MSVLSVIGNTPLVQLTKMVNNPKLKILCKLEGNNPGGSVKDRPAYYMVAYETARNLVEQEGIFVGMSSGAAVAGALRFAENIDSGTMVVILPDRGDRYLSTTLFRSVCAECPP